MLAARLTCPHCQRRLSFPLSSLGRKVLCPSCQTLFPLSLSCPTCGNDVEASGLTLGTTVVCNPCQRILLIPPAAGGDDQESLEELDELRVELGRFRDLNIEMRRRLKFEQEERLRIVQLAKLMRKSLDDSHREIERLRVIENAARVVAPDLEAERRRWADGLRVLREALSDQRSTHDQTRELTLLVDNLEQRLTTVRADQSQLQGRCGQIQHQSQRNLVDRAALDQAVAERDQLRAERDQLLARLAGANDRLAHERATTDETHASEVERLQLTSTSLMGEVERLEEALRVAEQRLDDERTTNRLHLVTDDGSWDVERQQLRDELVQLQAERDQDNREIHSLRETLEATQASLDEERNQTGQRLLAETETWQQERLGFCDQQGQFRTAIAHLAAQLASHRDELGNTHAHLDSERTLWDQRFQAEAGNWQSERQGLLDELTSHRESLTSLEAERTHREEQLRAEAKSWAVERQELADELERLRAERDRLESERERQQADLEAARTALESAAARAQEHIKTDATAWETERQNLRDELARVRMGLSILEKELAKHKSELATTRSTLDSERAHWSQQLSESASWTDQQQALLNDRDSLRGELEHLRSDHEERERQVTQLVEEAAATQQRLEAERAEGEQRRHADAASWNDERQQLSEELERLRGRLPELEVELARHKEDLAQANAALDSERAGWDQRLVAETGTWHAEKLGLHAELSGHHETVASLEAELARHKDELNEARARLDAERSAWEDRHQADRGSWEAEREAIEREHEALRQQVEQLRQAQPEREGELAHLRDEIQASQAVIEAERASWMRRLQAGSEAWDSERITLQNELNKLHGELNDMQARLAADLDEQRSWWETEQGLWEAERAGFGGELNHLKSRIAELTQLLASERAAWEGREAEQGDLWVEERARLEAQIDQARNEHATSAQESVDQARGLLNQRDDQIGHLTRERDEARAAGARQAALEQELQRLQDELGRLQEETTALRDQGQSTGQAVERLQAERDQLDADQRQWQDRAEEAQREIDGLREQLQETGRSSEVSVEDHRKLVAERDQLQRRQTQLEKSFADARQHWEALRRQLSTAEQQVAGLQQERDQLASQLRELQTAANRRRDGSTPSSVSDRPITLTNGPASRATTGPSPAISLSNPFDPELLHELAVGTIEDQLPPEVPETQEASPAPLPAAARDLLMQGWNLQQAGQLQEAIRCYRGVVSQVPGEAEALYLLGTVYLRLNDAATAGDYLRQASDRRPDRADFRCNLGVALAMKGDLEPAVAAFRETLRLNPSYAEARQNLNQALAELHSQNVRRP